MIEVPSVAVEALRSGLVWLAWLVQRAVFFAPVAALSLLLLALFLARVHAELTDALPERLLPWMDRTGGVILGGWAALRECPRRFHNRHG